MSYDVSGMAAREAERQKNLAASGTERVLELERRRNNLGNNKLIEATRQENAQKEATLTAEINDRASNIRRPFAAGYFATQLAADQKMMKLNGPTPNSPTKGSEQTQQAIHTGWASLDPQ